MTGNSPAGHRESAAHGSFSVFVGSLWEDHGMSSGRIAVCLEVTPKKTFASALNWPGWCRAGRDESAALEALASYAERYAPVAEQAGVSFPSTVAFDVVERVPGGSTTAFAAPECRRPVPQVTAQAERAQVTPAAARRLVGLVTAAWATFDEVAAASPAELRKGPRGGGRDRDKMIDHVLAAETAYARKLGVKLKQPAIDDLAAPSDGSTVVPKGWTTRYAARRIAWHVLDHAWEMQDRAEARWASWGGPAGLAGEHDELGAIPRAELDHGPADVGLGRGRADEQLPSNLLIAYPGPRLAPPEHHPLDQPVPGPAGHVPREWERYLR
jgi:hypothetical protein